MPDWYDSAMADADARHDGVAWRCRLHGRLEPHFVILLAEQAYCGSCGDGPADPLPLVSGPRAAPDPTRRTRRRRVGGGSAVQRVLEALRGAGPEGLRHADLLRRIGPGARAAVQRLGAHGRIRRVRVGFWRLP